MSATKISIAESTLRLSHYLRVDFWLMLFLIALCSFGFYNLYSASGINQAMLTKQLIHLGLGGFVFVFLSYMPVHIIRHLTPWVYCLTIALLIAVEFFGVMGKGAQRWIDLGFMRFQPSELAKLTIPLMVAWYLHNRTLPPAWRDLLICVAVIFIPVLLIFKQPDLGTSILVASAGFFALFFAGISWRLLMSFTILGIAIIPMMWYFVMHDYQKVRVMTLFNPESDPTGAGYHIIQSKIAIGSGGFYGKGWMEGTQSQLSFLPERHTDFIFAVIAEEQGFIGVVLLFILFALVLGRALVITATASDTFGRLAGGAISLTFLVYIFVNIGMVSGLLPVVGVPLPLVSYGGTSLVSLMIGFGILTAIRTQTRHLER